MLIRGNRKEANDDTRRELEAAYDKAEKGVEEGGVDQEEGLNEFEEATTDMKKHSEKYYIWRCVGDGKVRSSHADRDGQIFSWNEAPEGGHPGEEYNCRCIG